MLPVVSRYFSSVNTPFTWDNQEFETEVLSEVDGDPVDPQKAKQAVSKSLGSYQLDQGAKQVVRILSCRTTKGKKMRYSQLKSAVITNARIGPSRHLGGSSSLQVAAQAQAVADLALPLLDSKDNT
jgi:hypothetical protein